MMERGCVILIKISQKEKEKINHLIHVKKESKATKSNGNQSFDSKRN